MDSRSRFLRSLLWISCAFAVIFGAEFWLEWQRLGQPGPAELSWGDVDTKKIVDILSPMARAYNNILAMLIATIGLAIPLTANMHTPKLIDMFLRDRTNQVMLVVCSFGAANVLFTAYLVGPKFAPMWAYRIAVFGAIVGWAALIPYFFYVVRFLDPSNILERLKAQITDAIDLAQRGKLSADDAQAVVHERLNQIGTIVLKSIDRADRSVVTEGVWSLKQILDCYGKAKIKMPDAWFVVDRGDFVGMAAEALELLNEERTWFEMKVLGQMYLAYQQALAKSADAVSWISDATRVIGTAAHTRGDPRAVELTVRFFNNYLREAIKRKDMHALYDLFYQYRCLGRDVRDDTVMLRKIGVYFKTYSNVASNAGMAFAAQMAAFDLGWLVRRAYEGQSTAAPDLLADVLGMEHYSGGKLSAQIAEAKVILGAGLIEQGLLAEVALVRANLRDVPPDVLDHIEKTLLTDVEKSFWEVTDRQVNFEYIAPARRPFVSALVADIKAGQ